MEIRRVLEKILSQATGVYSPEELEAALFSGRRLTVKMGPTLPGRTCILAIRWRCAIWPRFSA